MREWPRVALGELLARADDTATLNLEDQYHEVTIRLWGKGVISRGKVCGSEVTTTRRFVRANQFILSKIDARNGAVGLVPPELDGAIVSNDFPSFTFRDSQRLDPAFMGWLARSVSFVKLCKAASEGTTNRVRIKESRFLDQRIGLPSLPEQHAIVARLDALADKTRQLTTHLDAIEECASAVLLSLHHRLSNNRKVRLSDVFELHEDSVPVEAGNAYPQVGVRGFGGGLFAKAAVTAAETAYRAFNRLHPNAIVMSQVKGWEGALALVPNELSGMFVSPEYRTFRCKPDKAHPVYLGELIKTPWFWALLQDATRGVGARRERTRPEQFLNIELPMPHHGEQERAVELLSRLMALKARHAAIRADNAALLPATLERLFAAADRNP